MISFNRHQTGASGTSGTRKIPATRVVSQAIAALAVSAVAIAALAVGALAIGRLAIGRARIRQLEDRRACRSTLARDRKASGSASAEWFRELACRT